MADIQEAATTDRAKKSVVQLMRVVGLCRRVPQTLVWEPSAWWRLVPTACLKGSMPWMMMNIACAACFILCQKHQQHLPESSLGVKSGSH